MPYKWITPSEPTKERQLHLWPYESLRPKGFVVFIGATSVLFLLPLFVVLGSVVLWGILPFLLMALAGVWLGLRRSHINARVLEVLTLTPDSAHLIRQNPKGDVQEWQCNIYWAQVNIHQTDGPVPNYVTLSGEGREVEIGAFLSEDERLTLYNDLLLGLADARA